MSIYGNYLAVGSGTADYVYRLDLKISKWKQQRLDYHNVRKTVLIVVQFRFREVTPYRRKRRERKMDVMAMYSIAKATNGRIILGWFLQQREILLAIVLLPSPELPSWWEPKE